MSNANVMDFGALHRQSALQFTKHFYIPYPTGALQLCKGGWAGFISTLQMGKLKPVSVRAIIQTWVSWLHISCFLHYRGWYQGAKFSL